MAKIAYNKLGCKYQEEVNTVIFNEQEIEVRERLPIQEKLALIGRVIELAHEQDYNYANPVKQKIYTELEIIFTYTNIFFTDKQKEDLPKLYDTMLSSGLKAAIFKAIPYEELQSVFEGVQKSSDSLYKYQNSVLGLMDTITKDYSNLDFDLDKLKDKISDPEQLNFVKDVLEKLR